MHVPESAYQLEVAVAPASNIPELAKTRVSMLSLQHPDFSTSVDRDSKQLIIHGRDEAHLEENVLLFKEALGVDLVVGAPQVIYRETVSRGGESRALPAAGQQEDLPRFAVQLAVQPLERGAGYVFETADQCPAFPEWLATPLTDALEKAVDRGVLVGFRLTDLKVSLVDWRRGEGDIAHAPVRRIVTLAFLEAVNRADPILLEPVSLMTVTSPEHFVGDVLGDLNARRGHILDAVEQGAGTVVTAHVPLAETFGYKNVLRRISSGRAHYRLEPSHYQRVPRRGGGDTPPSEPGAGALVA